MADREKEHALTIEAPPVVGPYEWHCICGVKGVTFYPDMRKIMGCPREDKNLVNKRT